MLDELQARFWSKVSKEGPVVRPELGPCWVWTSYRDPMGYGRFNITKRQPKLAHRVAYALVVGPIPDGIHACHRCDNPACVRPEHIFLGTALDNMRDMSRKGRHGGRSGAQHSQAKITADIAGQIRAAWSQGGVTMRALGRQFGLSHGRISAVVRGVYNP